MAYLGTLSMILAIWGGVLLRRKRLVNAKWFQRAALVGIALPFLANFAGWILTETGRQPWIVYGLQRTAARGLDHLERRREVGLSLAVFVGLYIALAIVDFWLMRRYARLDPPEIGDGASDAVPRYRRH